jgi:hypothetical protein
LFALHTETHKVEERADECRNSLDFHAHAHEQASSNMRLKQPSKNSQPFMSCGRHTAASSARSAKTSKHSTGHSQHEKINFCNSANGTAKLHTQQTQAIAMQLSLSVQCSCENAEERHSSLQKARKSLFFANSQGDCERTRRRNNTKFKTEHLYTLLNSGKHEIHNPHVGE